METTGMVIIIDGIWTPPQQVDILLFLHNGNSTQNIVNYFHPKTKERA